MNKYFQEVPYTGKDPVNTAIETLNDKVNAIAHFNLSKVLIISDSAPEGTLEQLKLYIPTANDLYIADGVGFGTSPSAFEFTAENVVPNISPEDYTAVIFTFGMNDSGDITQNIENYVEYLGTVFVNAQLIYVPSSPTELSKLKFLRYLDSVGTFKTLNIATAFIGTEITAEGYAKTLFEELIGTSSPRTLRSVCDCVSPEYANVGGNFVFELNGLMLSIRANVSVEQTDSASRRSIFILPNENVPTWCRGLNPLVSCVCVATIDSNTALRAIRLGSAGWWYYSPEVISGSATVTNATLNLFTPEMVGDI